MMWAWYCESKLKFHAVLQFVDVYFVYQYFAIYLYLLCYLQSYLKCFFFFLNRLIL